MTPLRQRMLHDMQIRNLADNTQKSYLIRYPVSPDTSAARQNC
jgi:hypothetical protein